MIDWSTDEVVQLLEKATRWWDAEKGELTISRDTGFFSISDVLYSEFSQLARLIAEIILPRLSLAKKGIKDLVIQLLQEMEHLNVSILVALPMTLFVKPDSVDEISRRLRNSLNSMDKEEIHDSIYALFSWLAYSYIRLIPSPPEDLLNEIANRVLTRRQPGLDSAIHLVSGVARRFPELLNAKQMDILCTALEYLKNETDLQNVENYNAPILALDIPDYRASVAKLAYWLFIWFDKNKKDMPEILVSWKEISESDSLPEVRKAWIH